MAMKIYNRLISRILVIKSFSPNSSRAGIASVPTIAKPLKMAPATKYGGKIEL